MWLLFLLSSSRVCFFLLPISWLFFERWTKVPECLHCTNLSVASWICPELRKRWRAAGWAAVAAHAACPLLTLSPGPRDAWQMEAWHPAPAGYTRLSVSYLCEQKLLWAARASHLGHTGRKSHLLTEFYWVMMELSFMVSRWGLSGFRWWLALLAEYMQSRQLLNLLMSPWRGGGSRITTEVSGLHVNRDSTENLALKRKGFVLLLSFID